MAISVAAEKSPDIRIVAPYAGWVANQYLRESDHGDIELTDTDLMLGLYTQWIRPDMFQANLFAYHAPDVNYAQLWGLHSNVDGYFSVGSVDNVVVGGGVELISLDIDAGDNITLENDLGSLQVEDFRLRNTLIVPFFRLGKRFPASTAQLNVTAFPWIGAELSLQNGDLSFTVPAMPPFSPSPQDREIQIDEVDPYALAGLNLRATLFHVLQFDAKYSASFDADSLHNRVSVMTNLFFTRNWGLSWRFSYMETAAGSTAYNIFGLVGVF